MITVCFVHQIDSVLIPPAGDCLAVAAANGLDSFVAAVKTANLTEALTDPNGTFTIFAPTNEALARAIPPQQYLTELFQRGGWILHIQR